MMMKSVTHSKKKYFSQEEYWQTISSKKYNPRAKLEEKEYKYNITNAIYKGTWKGGFRHGKGIMIWSDGALYEGNFNFGKATG